MPESFVTLKLTRAEINVIAVLVNQRHTQIQAMPRVEFNKLAPVERDELTRQAKVVADLVSKIG